jgi:hypothetical protein
VRVSGWGGGGGGGGADECNVHLRSPTNKYMHTFAQHPHMSTCTCVRVCTLHIAEAVRKSEAWQTHFLPLLLKDLAADARAAGRVHHVLAAGAGGGGGGSPLLACPVHTYCGVSDPAFTVEQAPRWAALTSASAVASSGAAGQDQGGARSGSRHSGFHQHFFPGGHEFMNECSDHIFAQVCVCIYVTVGRCGQLVVVAVAVAAVV